MSNTAEKTTAISPDEVEQELDIIKGKIVQCQQNYEQRRIGIGKSCRQRFRRVRYFRFRSL